MRAGMKVSVPASMLPGHDFLILQFDREPSSTRVTMTVEAKPASFQWAAARAVDY
jgi:hypothetical protein